MFLIRQMYNEGWQKKIFFSVTFSKPDYTNI
jgi:hypothetical protein